MSQKYAGCCHAQTNGFSKVVARLILDTDGCTSKINSKTQESPPAWTQEAYRPQRIKYSICCPIPGGWGGEVPWGTPPPGVDRLKTLPSPILRMRSVIILNEDLGFHCILHGNHFTMSRDTPSNVTKIVQCNSFFLFDVSYSLRWIVDDVLETPQAPETEDDEDSSSDQHGEQPSKYSCTKSLPEIRREGALPKPCAHCLKSEVKALYPSPAHTAWNQRWRRFTQALRTLPEIRGEGALPKPCAHCLKSEVKALYPSPAHTAWNQRWRRFTQALRTLPEIRGEGALPKPCAPLPEIRGEGALPKPCTHCLKSEVKALYPSPAHTAWNQRWRRFTQALHTLPEIRGEGALINPCTHCLNQCRKFHDLEAVYLPSPSFQPGGKIERRW